MGLEFLARVRRTAFGAALFVALYAAVYSSLKAGLGLAGLLLGLAGRGGRLAATGLEALGDPLFEGSDLIANDVREMAATHPAAVRATGVGSAASIGRVGGILSSYAGAWALQGGGTGTYFYFLAGSMAASLVALALVTRHVARPTSN